MYLTVSTYKFFDTFYTFKRGIYIVSIKTSKLFTLILKMMLNANLCEKSSLRYVVLFKQILKISNVKIFTFL